MDRNKSIDGLITRRSKQAASSLHSKTRAASVSAKSKSARHLNKTAARPASKATSKVAPKATPKTVSKTAPGTTPKTPTPKSTLASSKNAPSTQPSNPTPDQTPQPTDGTSKTPQANAADFLKPVQAFDFDEQSGELKASAKPVNASKKPTKEKKPISKKRKIIIRIILGLVALLLIAVIWFIIWGNDILSKITGGQGNILDLFSEHYEPLKTDANGRTNILAFGTSGYNMEGDEGKGTHDGAQLTDSIMVISLNQESGDVAMLSLPRDLKVSSTCTATGKINEVYWCNNTNGDNEQAGAEALMETVHDVLGVDLQYYAHLNWGSLIQIVNTLDGIKVTLDEDISDYGWTGAVYQAGTEYTLNGDQALGLARARHGTTSGDFTRGASQQKILIGIRDKITEKNLSIPDLISIASTLGDNLRTNFSVDELKTAAHLVTDMDFDHVRQVSLIEPEKYVTTSNINGISYVVPVGGVNSYKRIHEYVAKMFSNDPRQYENASILVLNGTDTVGIASTEQEKLESDGYTNVDISDAPDGEYASEYALYALTDDKPGTKKLLQEKYNQEAKPAAELPAGISTDYDFVIILGSTSQAE